MEINSGGNHLFKDKAVFNKHFSKSPNYNYFSYVKTQQHVAWISTSKMSSVFLWGQNEVGTLATKKS